MAGQGLQDSGSKGDGEAVQAPPRVEVQPEERDQRQDALLLLLDAGTDQPLLTYGRLREVQDQLSNLETDPESLHLDVILGSPGGDPHAAYKIAKMLRERAHSLRFFICEYAKSAATLVALAGDEILMSPDAELGPLDVQMEIIPLEGKGRLSAIDAIRPLDDMADFSKRVTFSLGKKIRDQMGLSRKDSLELALRHVEGLLRPMMEKLEPSAVSEARRALDVTRLYAEDLLSRYHLNQEGPESERKAVSRRIASELVYAFPEHGFVITRDRAQELGLVVRPAEQDPSWEVIQAIYRKEGGLRGSRVHLFTRDDIDKADIGKDNEGNGEVS